MNETPEERRKRRKLEALQSAFMRIPSMPVESARDLLDLGFSETYELVGRCPDALYADLCERDPEANTTRRAGLRLATYFAEESDPEPERLRMDAWLH